MHYKLDHWNDLGLRLADCLHPDSWRCASPCACAHAMVTKYQKRISGPLLDRIDIHIEVPRVDYEKLSGNKLSETSEVIRQRVQAARNIQQTRFVNPREASRTSKTESSNII